MDRWSSIKITGHDGNAFGILGRVSKEMRRAGVPNDDGDWWVI